MLKQATNQLTIGVQCHANTGRGVVLDIQRKPRRGKYILEEAMSKMGFTAFFIFFNTLYVTCGTHVLFQDDSDAAKSARTG